MTRQRIRPVSTRVPSLDVEVRLIATGVLDIETHTSVAIRTLHDHIAALVSDRLPDTAERVC